MKERRSSKSGNPKRGFLQFLFSLFCVAGMAGGLWLFWTDLNQLLGRTSEQSVGILSYKRNTVQRRFKDRLAWNRLPNKSPVYNGDLIRTADLSDATVTFDSNDRIGLSENSLIVIYYDEKTGEAKMELIGGKVNLRSQSGKAVILAGGKELRPEAGSDFEIMGGSTEAEFLALSGAAVISAPDETISLKAGQSAVSGSGGTSVASDIVTVLRPLPDEAFSAAGVVDFLWQYSNSSGEGRLPEEEYIRIEVSGDRHFTAIAYSADEYDPAVTSAALSLAPGIWWWRLSRAGRENGVPAAVREGRITVIEPPPENPPLSPAALASLQELTGSNSESPLTVPLLPPPPVEAAPPPEPDPPPRPAPDPRPALLPRAAGLTPAPGTIIDGDFLKNSRSIVLSWNAVAGADAYLCTIRQGADILKQVYEPRLELNPLGTLVNGPCVWRVEAIRLAADGGIEQRGIIAESRFTVAVPRPAIPQVDNPGIIYER